MSLSLPTFNQDGRVFGKCSLRVEEDLRNTAQLPPALKLQPAHLSNLRLLSWRWSWSCWRRRRRG